MCTGGGGHDAIAITIPDVEASCLDLSALVDVFGHSRKKGMALIQPPQHHHDHRNM